MRPTILSRKPLPRLREALYASVGGLVSVLHIFLLCLFSQTLGLPPRRESPSPGRGGVQGQTSGSQNPSVKEGSSMLMLWSLCKQEVCEAILASGWVSLGVRVRPSGRGQRARQGTAGWLGQGAELFSGVQLPHRKKGSRGNKGRRT